MGEFIIVGIWSVVILVAIPGALLYANYRMTASTKKETEEYQRKIRESTANPDFDGFEAHYGYPLPAPLRELYRRSEEVGREDFHVAPSEESPKDERRFIAFYNVLGSVHWNISRPGCERLHQFADDGSGNGYLIDPSHEDPAVMLRSAQTGRIKKICDSLAEFMRWPRLEVER